MSQKWMRGAWIATQERTYLMVSTLGNGLDQARGGHRQGGRNMGTHITEVAAWGMDCFSRKNVFDSEHAIRYPCAWGDISNSLPDKINTSGIFATSQAGDCTGAV